MEVEPLNRAFPKRPARSGRQALFVALDSGKSRFLLGVLLGPKPNGFRKTVNGTVRTLSN